MRLQETKQCLTNGAKVKNSRGCKRAGETAGKHRTIQEIIQGEASRSVDSIYEMHHSARPVLALAYEEALIILG